MQITIYPGVYIGSHAHGDAGGSIAAPTAESANALRDAAEAGNPAAQVVHPGDIPAISRRDLGDISAGALVLISHDRAFCEAVRATHVGYLAEGAA